nr:RNA-directed DNA polymerase, eukaryota, reverse transcriptase zinc-binding domain protein [Tanacetum cinerariifolium]
EILPDDQSFELFSLEQTTWICLSKEVVLLPHPSVLQGSVKEEDRQSILSVIPFRVEKLPVKYLEIPLISKRIRVKDCKSLVDNVRNKVLDWKNKCLSYAGRLQLDKKANGRALVTWKNLCKPKSHGGLGLKNLSSWNKALIIKHLWHIAMDKNTMWVRCINTFKLKGRSLWEINEDVNDSCGWRNILRMRQLMIRNIFVHIGNGSKISIWFDYWNECGILYEHVTYRDIYDARFNTSITVKEFIEDKDQNDVLRWRKRDGYLGDSSMRQAYCDLHDYSKIFNWSEFGLGRKLVRFDGTMRGLRDKNQGRNIHEHLVKHGYTSNPFSCNVLVDIYSKVGNFKDANVVFECIPKPDIILWNAVIASRVLHEDYDMALELM